MTGIIPMSNMGVKFDGVPHQHLGHFLDMRNVDHDDDDDLSHSQFIESNFDVEMYRYITITGKRLGSGGYGWAYPALYRNPDPAIPTMKKCVVKLPLNLIQNHIIEIDWNGNIHLNERISDDDKRSFSRAVSNFKGEWEHSFMLRFGRGVSKLGMDNVHWKITGAQFLKAQCERMELKRFPGFDNIHSVQGIDLRVPLIMSEYFDGTLSDLSALNFMVSNPDIRQAYMYKCIIPQTYAGLRYMHIVAGLAHMDIKPQNMLYKFVPGNMYPQVVLSDFGSCVDAKTQINGDIGTRGYAAPEVEQENQVAGIFKERAYYMPIHADAFSWALSMMDIIHPSTYYSKNLYEKIQKLEERNPSTQNLHGMELKIFQKMTKIMQKNPKDRYKLFRNIQKLLPSS